ncbi:hypothetical protein NDU88_003013 [Pleurodeles waltl]|uniref:Secreted protein n=1 Tax=Pleurodeles waltl TaxID=8319 RepID=A0AAV7UBC1_PLEWA|nr:hypothetical protein NDU88_003013 [Pleurodeles waltl]
MTFVSVVRCTELHAAGILLSSLTVGGAILGRDHNCRRRAEDDLAATPLMQWRVGVQMRGGCRLIASVLATDACVIGLRTRQIESDMDAVLVISVGRDCLAATTRCVFIHQCATTSAQPFCLFPRGLPRDHHSLKCYIGIIHVRLLPLNV